MQTERGRESNERLIEDSERTGDTIKMEEVGAHVEVFPTQTEFPGALALDQTPKNVGIYYRRLKTSHVSAAF